MTIQRSNDLSHGQGFKSKTKYGPDTAEEVILELRKPENRAQPSARKQSRQKGLFHSSLLKHRKRKRGQDMMKCAQIKHLIFSKTTNIINTCNGKFLPRYNSYSPRGALRDWPFPSGKHSVSLRFLYAFKEQTHHRI